MKIIHTLNQDICRTYVKIYENIRDNVSFNVHQLTNTILIHDNRYYEAYNH